MKLFIRFFLSLCFLLSGYGNLYTYAHQEYIFNSPVKLLESSDGGSSFAQHIPEIHYHSSIPEAETAIDVLEVTNSEDENDENNFAPVKKLPASLNYFSNLFNRHTRWHLSQNIQNSLHLSKPSYISAGRYLLLCVIRI
jgi:hypothetical protein